MLLLSLYLFFIYTFISSDNESNLFEGEDIDIRIQEKQLLSAGVAEETADASPEFVEGIVDNNNNENIVELGEMDVSIYIILILIINYILILH